MFWIINREAIKDNTVCWKIIGPNNWVEYVWTLESWGGITGALPHARNVAWRGRRTGIFLLERDNNPAISAMFTMG